MDYDGTITDEGTNAFFCGAVKIEISTRRRESANAPPSAHKGKAEKGEGDIRSLEGRAGDIAKFATQVTSLAGLGLRFVAGWYLSANIGVLMREGCGTIA